MKVSCIFVLAVVLMGLMTSVRATSEPVCSYENSQGQRIFLRYLPYIKEGESYIDKDSNGVCLRRVKCTPNYNTSIDECSKYGVTCDNRGTSVDEFPACCVKC